MGNVSCSSRRQRGRLSRLAIVDGGLTWRAYTPAYTCTCTPPTALDDPVTHLFIHGGRKLV